MPNKPNCARFPGSQQKPPQDPPLEYAGLTFVRWRNPDSDAELYAIPGDRKNGYTKQEIIERYGSDHDRQIEQFRRIYTGEK